MQRSLCPRLLSAHAVLLDRLEVGRAAIGLEILIGPVLILQPAKVLVLSTGAITCPSPIATPPTSTRCCLYSHPDAHPTCQLIPARAM